MDFIRLADALDKMEEKHNGMKVPFDIVFVTYDEQRNTGGKLKEMKNMVRCGLAHNMNDNYTIGIQPADGSGHVIAVHTWLITRYNKMKILP